MDMLGLHSRKWNYLQPPTKPSNPEIDVLFLQMSSPEVSKHFLSWLFVDIILQVYFSLLFTISNMHPKLCHVLGTSADLR